MWLRVLFHVQHCHSLCTHLSAYFPGNSSVDWSIVSHNPMFANLLGASVPLFFFFLSPSIGRLGNRRSSFEPITQPDPLIITNLPESLIRGLPNSAMCTQCGFRLSPAVCFFYFFPTLVQGREVKREGERKRQSEGEGERVEREREGDCLHTFAHLSLGIFHQSEIRQVCGRVSILGTQWTTHKGFISSYLLPYTFPRHSSFESLCSSSLEVLLISRSHAGRGTCLVNYTVEGFGPLKADQNVPDQQCLCAVYHCREYSTLPHRYMAAHQTMQVKQWEEWCIHRGHTWCKQITVFIYIITASCLILLFHYCQWEGHYCDDL